MIQNCTVLNGTKTKYAALAQCGRNTAKFISCEIESGVVCGWDKENNAPGTENCLVKADITGARAVGGIFGGEGGVNQIWDSATSYIRNNVFIGTLNLNGKEVTPVGGHGSAANTIDGTKGGIVGFMRSLNKNAYFENNYFYVTNNSEASTFGAVEHIDTSAKPFSGTTKEFIGVGDDTPQKYYENFTDVFYYNTSRDDSKNIKKFVDREDFGQPDYNSYTSVLYTGMHRTDDPMGADADKLGKAMTATTLKDGSVVAALNGNADSLHNWKQGENGPEISSEPVAYKLEIGGEYKTEYYIGDTLDMTGATFTATRTEVAVILQRLIGMMM